MKNKISSLCSIKLVGGGSNRSNDTLDPSLWAVSVKSEGDSSVITHWSRWKFHSVRSQCGTAGVKR